MKYLAILGFIFIAQAQAQDCNCQSQLMRVEIQGSALKDILTSPQQLDNTIKPGLQTYFSSEAFKKKFLGEYPIESTGFPFNKIHCEKEKSQGDPKFKDVDCEDPYLCSNPDVPEGAKSEVCLSLPCSMILGSQNMSQCAPQGVASPSKLHFIEPVKLNKIDLSLKSLDINGDDQIKACFDLNELDTSVGVGIEFNKDPQVNYEQMGLKNLNIKLDGKREICMTGKLNLGSPEPLTDIKLERPPGNFVSDAMINRAISGSEIVGVSGYSPATINVLKLTAAPALARHFRPTIEDAVQSTLALTFQNQVSTMVAQLDNKGTPVPSEIVTPANSVISEMGVGNIAVKKYVDLFECSLLKHKNKPIPSDHACLTSLYNGKSKPLKEKQIPRIGDAADTLKDKMGRYDQVTSQVLKQRLLDMEAEMDSPELSQLFNSHIKPITQKITKNQDESKLISGVELISKIGDINSMSGVGIALPDICDVTNPSPHMGRSIPNCPVQTYVDLNELNNLLTSMYNSGRLCHRGRGDYVPELDSKGEQVRNSDGSPRGSGCLLAIEEDEDGMRCYLNGAPKLSFDPKSGGYKVDLKTKECFRGSVILGQGKIGGDINFSMGFTPNICEGGDFCLEDGNADWEVVPGTARYALKESSWFSGIVRKTIDKQLNGMMSETIRMPISSNTGPMAMIPLEAEGRVDKGPGFFGACLQPKK